MRNLRAHLLASVAVVGLSGTVYAADMGPPVKAPPPAPIPYATWQGWYVGGNVGAARMNSSCTGNIATSNTATGCGDAGTSGGGGTSLNITDTGVAAGVQVGYDWQDRYFVYGVAADWSWTNLKHTVSGSFGAYGTQAKVDWLASFRGRMGLALDNNLVYFTGGLALGQLKGIAAVHNVIPFGGVGHVTVNYSNLSKTQVGWVAGLGIAHKFNPQWSVFAEFLYYDFGRVTDSQNIPAVGSLVRSVHTYQTEWNFEVLEARVGLNYHF
jgi:outer membrane immunogenic protein